ncbi:MAG: hypothetical protein IKD68_07045 [Solobacterium sp.]|nr:hypothetical protein [Solobacterium sp.]
MHSLVTYEKEGDLDARRKGGRIFREYDRACKSEYGEVFPVLKDLLRTFLHLNGVDALDPKAEAKK